VGVAAAPTAAVGMVTVARPLLPPIDIFIVFSLLFTLFLDIFTKILIWIYNNLMKSNRGYQRYYRFCSIP
jgi:hypothetical protein